MISIELLCILVFLLYVPNISFSNLFGAPQQLAIGSGPTSLSRSSSTLVSYHPDQAPLSGGLAGNTSNTGLVSSGAGGMGGELSFVSGGGVVGAGSVSSGGGIVVGGVVNQPIRSINQRLNSNSDLIVLMDTDLNMDRSRSSATLGIVGLGPSRDGTSRFMTSSSEQQGYIHAYGWSLPVASFRNMSLANSWLAAADDQHNQSTTSSTTLMRPVSAALGRNSTMSLRIPIPQYCRPLTGDSQGMKIWCATAIDLSGGDTLGAGDQMHLVIDTFDMQQGSLTSATTDQQAEQSSESLVNISATSNLTSTPRKDLLLDETASAAINELEQEVDQALKESQGSSCSSHLGPVSSTPHPRISLGGRLSLASNNDLNLRLKASRSQLATNHAINSANGEDLSSCVWICSTQHSRSKVTVIDIKNKPNEMLESFHVPTFLYCIRSVPGCKVYDLPGLLSNNPQGKETKSPLMILIDELIATQRGHFYKLVKVNEEQASRALAERIEARCQLMMRQNSANLNATTTVNTTIIEHDSTFYGERSLEEEISSSQNVDAAIDPKDKTITTIGDDLNASGATDLDEDPVISKILDNNICDGISKLEKLNEFVAHTQEETTQATSNNPNDASITTNEDGFNEDVASDKQSDSSRKLSGPHHHPISTHLPTVWMGGKDSILYVHSAIGQWGDLVDCVKLPDSILQIFDFRGRVFVALADGLLCVFFRDLQTKQWDLRNYLQIDINLLAEISASDISSNNFSNNQDAQVTQEQTSSQRSNNQNQEDGASLSEQLRNATEQKERDQLQKRLALANAKRLAAKSKVAGIRCIELANNNLWIGYRNRVLIVDPISLKLKHSISVVPQLDNQVRQLVSMKDGVFCCLRSDLMLRLYSSLKPYQHIQNIDIEPVVTRLLSPRTFVISHITSMKVADNMVWIGIAHGIIITIPCGLETLVSETTIVTHWKDDNSVDKQPQIARGSDSNSSTSENNANNLTSCMSIAKSIPKCDIANAQISFHGHKDAVKFFIHTHGLMLSGGQGYLDFRLDMDDQSKSINDKSHLILWQMPDA